MYTKHFINFVFVKEIEIEMVFLNLILDIISSQFTYENGFHLVMQWHFWANSIDAMIGMYIHFFLINIDSQQQYIYLVVMEKSM